MHSVGLCLICARHYFSAVELPRTMSKTRLKGAWLNEREPVAIVTIAPAGIMTTAPPKINSYVQRYNSSADSIKRRRLSAADSSSLCLSDLPTGALSQVSSFLAAPWRAFLPWPSNVKMWMWMWTAVRPSELTAKPSDNDISAVLTVG